MSDSQRDSAPLESPNPVPPRPAAVSYAFLTAVQVLLGSAWMAEAIVSGLHEPSAAGYLRGGGGVVLMLAAFGLSTRSYASLGLVATLDSLGALLLVALLIAPQSDLSDPPVRSMLFWPVYLLCIPGFMLSVSQAVTMYRQKEAFDAWQADYGATDEAGLLLDAEATAATDDDEMQALGDTTDWDQATPDEPEKKPRHPR